MPDRLRALALIIAGLVVVASGAPSDAASPRLLSPAALQADLRFAVEAIERMHPDMGHSVDREAFRRAVRSVEADLDHAMDRDDAWAAFARLNPVLADGHLLIGYPDWREESAQALAAGVGHFPFEITVDPDDGVRIVAALGGMATPLAGRRIDRINGVDSGRIVDAMLARTHGDTPRFRRALLSRRWWFFYRRLFGTPDAYDLRLADAGPSTVRLEASRAVPALLREEADFDRLFRLEFLPDDTALMTLASFDWPDRERFLAFARDSFAAIRAAGVRRLVVDIRNNGGGDDSLWKEGVLRYVAERPYRAGSRYIKRVLEAYRDEGEVTGEVVRGEIDSFVEPEIDPERHFRGELYVLIGPLTYSSAILFANVVQDHGFGRLVGIGDAARTRQSGGVQTVALPNSGLVLSYPRFVLVRPSGASDPALLRPDIMIEDDPGRPRAAVDALLASLGPPQRGR